ncbi:hypothetical protein [Fontivita pretiosa]|uniref:hypothetical protein n=1 Tax=Fontivita pretiosa TaxID=2989684 RepID=UPI003D179947
MPQPLIWPSLLLLIVALLTLVALGAQAVLDHRRRRALSALARQWQMHYSPTDVLNLAPRVAAHLPVVGAADVVVRDLIYGTEPSCYRYIFSVEYTTGVVRAKSRRRCVVCATEPRARGQSIWTSFRVARADRSLLEQYRCLSA